MRLAKRMLIGTEVWDHGARRLYNSALYVDPREGVIGRYDKVHLVPFGEYIPLREELPFIVDLVQRYSGLSLIDMQPGKGWEVFECRGERFGVAICFEGLFPEITRVYKDQGASFLLNISNDGWFKGSAELDQILQICVFRAVEFRIGVVRATNTGISAFISPDGRIDRVLESPNGKRKEIEGVLEGPILLSSSGSLYTEFGDMVLYSLTFVMGCIILMRSFVLIYRRYFG
jgi:apolipoprotein N-acyltransferase